MLFHAQNRGQGGAGIKSTFGSKYALQGTHHEVRWQATRSLLFDFDPHQVGQKYDIYSLFARLKEPPFNRFRPTIPDYSFCLSIIMGAEYFRQFTSAIDFYELFTRLAQDKQPERKAQQELEKIVGYGPALALDFLKELGFEQYIKPDVHTMDICFWLGHTQSERDIIGTIAVMKQIASDAGATPYSLDKLFWLIGSGNFYDVPIIPEAESQKAFKKWFNKSCSIQRKRAFVDYVKERI